VTAPASPPVEAAAFRAVMSRWATGVSVVTARVDGLDHGLTVNSFQSVSLKPPSVFVLLTEDADTLPAIERSGHFGVSFLGADQRELSERFARTVAAREKFAGVPVHRGPSGTALIDGHVGALEARLTERRPLFDHLLVVGAVTYVEPGRDQPPLVYYRSGYAAAEGPDRLKLSTGHP
jgi:flavin reductase